MLTKFWLVFLETLPILFGIVLSYLLWQNNVVLALVYLALIFGLMYVHKDKSEYIIFLYGVFIGFLVETIGTSISGYQSFTKPDFMGIPMWLPIVWGYGFIAMKRIGIILKN